MLKQINGVMTELQIEGISRSRIMIIILQRFRRNRNIALAAILKNHRLGEKGMAFS